MIELGGGGEAASRGSSQCTQETDEHIRCGCGSALRTRRNGLAALISEGNAYALLTGGVPVIVAAAAMAMVPRWRRRKGRRRWYEKAHGRESAKGERTGRVCAMGHAVEHAGGGALPGSASLVPQTISGLWF